MHVPGESDTLNWGSGCQTPNGEVNWTEVTAHHTPNDVRGLGITGPFTFPPGEVRELDLAFVFARDYVSADTLASVIKLREMIDIIRNAFKTNMLPGGGTFLAVDAKQSGSSVEVTVYPVPASDKLNISSQFLMNQYEILNLFGQVIQCGKIPREQQAEVIVDQIPSGFYFLNVYTEKGSITKKILIIR